MKHRYWQLALILFHHYVASIILVLYYDIIFNRVVGDVPSSDLSLTERVIIMSTYEELQIILTTALLIVAILSYTNKK